MSTTSLYVCNRTWKLFLLLLFILGWNDLHAQKEPAKRLPDDSSQQWLDPLTSDSPFTGLSDSAPMVQVNEYTGKATVTIDTIGVSGMSVAPTLQQEVLFVESSSTSNQDAPRRFDNKMMAGWQAHQGYLRADWNWERKAPGQGYPSTRLRYVRANGSVLEFQENRAWAKEVVRLGERYAMDHTFEPSANIFLSRFDLPNTQPVEATPSGEPHAPHGWRRSLYKMQEPDGSVTTLRLAGFVDDQANSDQQHRHAIYVPVERRSASGRVIKIHYDGEGEWGIGHNVNTDFQPRVKYLEDPWQRRLVYHYETIGDLPRLRHLTLQQVSASNTESASYQQCGREALSARVGNRGGNYVSGSSCQRLAEFQYLQVAGEWVLRRWVKPDGQTTIFNYSAQFGRPLISAVTLPTGGQIGIQFALFELPTVILAPVVENEPQICSHSESRYCWVATTQRYVRVSRLQHSGGTYSYAYEAKDVNTPNVSPNTVKAIRPDWSWSNGVGYYLVTNVQLQGAEENYHRVTYYSHPKPDTSHIQGSIGHYVGTGSSGSPVARVETYNAAGMSATEKALFWNYYDPADQSVPPGNGTLYVADKAPRVQGFVERLDGVEMLTQFDYLYEVNLPQSPWDPLVKCYPDWVREELRRSSQLMCAGMLIRTRQQTVSSPVAEQRFEYHHEFPSVSPAESLSAANEPLLLGLPKDAKSFQDNVLTQWFKRSYLPGTGLEDEHQQARVVRIIDGNWPYNPSWIKRKRDYYTTSDGPLNGLLKQEYVGVPEYATRVLDYQYDVPVATQLPDSQPVYKKVDLAGRLTHTIIDNAVERSEFDDTGRLLRQYTATKSNPGQAAANTPVVRTCWKVAVGPSAANCSSSHGLSDPNWVSNQATAAASDSSSSSWVAKDSVLDAWGRPIKTYNQVDDATQGLVSQTTYSAIGFKKLEFDVVNNMTTKTWHDVVGRPLKQVRYQASESDAEVISEFQYSKLADGRSIVRKTQSTLVLTNPEDSDSAKEYRSIVTHNEVDFFGRPIKQGTEAHGVAQGEGRYTQFSYSFNPDNGQFRTEIRPDGGRYRSLRFDMLGNLLAENHPEFDGVIYNYDPQRGLLVDTEYLVRPDSQLTGPRIWRNSYDNVGRLTHVHSLVSIDDSPTQLLYHSYDEWGRLKSQGASVDKVHQVTRFDDVNRPHVVTSNLGDFDAGPEIETSTLDADSDARIQWQAADNARFYLLELEQNGSNKWRQTIEAPLTSATVSAGTLQAGVDTLIKVRSVNQEFQPSYWETKTIDVSGETRFRLSKNQLEFSANINQTDAQIFSVINQSAERLSFILAWPGAFAGPKSFEVAANTSLPIEVRFSPTQPSDDGEFSVDFTHDGETQSLTLIGEVQASCHLTLLSLEGSSEQLDFGTVVDGTVVSQQVRVTSRHCSPQTYATVSLPAPFGFSESYPRVVSKVVDVSRESLDMTIYYHADVDYGLAQQVHQGNVQIAIDRTPMANLAVKGVSQTLLNACQLQVAAVNFGEVPASSDMNTTSRVRLNHQCPETTTGTLRLNAPFYVGQSTTANLTFEAGQPYTEVELSFRPNTTAQQSYSSSARVVAQGAEITSFNLHARVGPPETPNPALIQFASSACDQGNGQSGTPCEASVMASNSEGNLLNVQFLPVLEPNTVMQNIEVELLSASNNTSVGRFELNRSQDADKWPGCMAQGSPNRCWASFRFIPANSAPPSGSVNATAVVRNPDRQQTLYLNLKGSYVATPTLTTPSAPINIGQVPLNQSRSGAFSITNHGGRPIYYCIENVRPGSLGANLVTLGIPRCSDGNMNIEAGTSRDHAPIIYAREEEANVGDRVDAIFNLRWFTDEHSGELYRGEFSIQMLGDVTAASDRLTISETLTRFANIYSTYAPYSCTTRMKIRKTTRYVDGDQGYFMVDGVSGVDWFDSERFPGMLRYEFDHDIIFIAGDYVERDLKVRFTREHMDAAVESSSGITGQICLHGRWNDQQDSTSYCVPAAAFHNNGEGQVLHCN
ncbi:hypothetical protein [Pleionea sp. CnH1-48]|uniref:hypothetical protein n=1 Tax=Pleionea sp. CnH1-48 TaxID=2954494 RepID=UPI00209864D9|nr:hypothetical protein [Pleionea sp. CnH1-48]MCO7223287.1 hypothetical protein [Pleionea sp. CnH1-48]